MISVWFLKGFCLFSLHGPFYPGVTWQCYFLLTWKCCRANCAHRLPKVCSRSRVLCKIMKTYEIEAVIGAVPSLHLLRYSIKYGWSFSLHHYSGHFKSREMFPNIQVYWSLSEYLKNCVFRILFYNGIQILPPPPVYNIQNMVSLGF